MNINTTRNCGMVEYYSALRKSNITPFVQHSTRGYHAKWNHSKERGGIILSLMWDLKLIIHQGSNKSQKAT